MYLRNVHLNKDKQGKTHIFSQFFYKCLTSAVHKNKDQMTTSQKRHNRVSRWTKDVNIFAMDCLIFPVLKQSHWILALISFISRLDYPCKFFVY
jgi:Ulp1 family protease